MYIFSNSCPIRFKIVNSKINKYANKIKTKNKESNTFLIYFSNLRLIM